MTQLVSLLFLNNSPPLSWGSTWGRNKVPWSARLSTSIPGLSGWSKIFFNAKVVQLINILWGTCKTRAQPFSDMWRKPFLNNLFERVNLDHQLQLHQRNFILHKSKLNYISQINFGENNGRPVQLQDCREVLRILVKEVLRWISRHKLVAELKYSLIIDHFY